MLIVKFEHFYGDRQLFKDTAPTSRVSCSRTLSLQHFIHFNHHTATVCVIIFYFIFFTLLLQFIIKEQSLYYLYHYIAPPC